MTKTHELICIVCPMGCHLIAEAGPEGVKVRGNSCPRGESYAVQEITAPTRMLTSTVRLVGGAFPVLPVRTSRPVPKEKLFDCMREINAVTAEAPVRAGEVLLFDLAGTGADLVAEAAGEACGGGQA